MSFTFHQSENMASSPRQAIRRIKSNSPNDPRSPFYDETGADIKPLARLILSRQRLYEKQCDNMGETGEDFLCTLGDWSSWSPCGVTCGRGMSYRQRHAIGNGQACEKFKKMERRICNSPYRCPESEEMAYDSKVNCTLTSWGQWSNCTVPCGFGTRTRSRRYQTRRAAKVCPVQTKSSPTLEQNDECYKKCEDGENFADQVRNCW